jgi:hypothetical protein
MRSFTCLLAMLLAMTLGVRAYALGSDHPANYPVNLTEVPAGVNELINQTNRVHGYFVNAEDRFFYAGGTAAFEAFLAQYAKLAGIAGHRLIVHAGRGQAKSPWDKGEGKGCDWMMDVAPVSWIEGHREVVRDTKADTPKSGNREYLVEIHVWTAGNVDLANVTIPAIVKVQNENQPEHKDKSAKPSEGSR